eukprot:gene13770-biopygen8248
MEIDPFGDPGANGAAGSGRDAWYQGPGRTGRPGAGGTLGTRARGERVGQERAGRLVPARTGRPGAGGTLGTRARGERGGRERAGRLVPGRTGRPGAGGTLGTRARGERGGQERAGRLVPGPGPNGAARSGRDACGDLNVAIPRIPTNERAEGAVARLPHGDHMDIFLS